MGRATIMALLVVAVLFIAQTYLAALLVPGKTAFSDNEVNQAFNHWLDEKLREMYRDHQVSEG